MNIFGVSHVSFKRIFFYYKTWIPQDFRQEHRITTEDSAKGTRPFKTTLDLANVNYKYVGEYYCIYTEYLNTSASTLNELRSTFKVSSIYLFVKCKFIFWHYIHFRSNLFIIFSWIFTAIHLVNHLKSSAIINGKQFDATVIPCRPSTFSNKINLKFHDKNGNKVNFLSF